ncbi:hypothetical protein Rhow_008424 [Rhodococcus wratislaviensis]|uniref:Uncharacterized protein n=1 Tax=Rhodococcus wratislaviensis TaxID=44752 RepID=A0A402CKF6_RHOWR|nr:CHAT domain-containing protein [Rhodococcus wratislaviensis]GCE44126.1 hypothetical protein Rhow_008424 [Rhodococcus wratislaviensis]
MIGRVRAYVFKFAARIVAGKAIAFLERDTRRGLVAIESANLTGWRPVDGLSDVALPTGRPARLLLLIHGTFSSTVGSFGALAATPEGRHFLESALSSYDAVLGFDHPTLSLDPLENAGDLLRRLSTADVATPPTVDVLCYSRGGLVARSLIEHLLPSSTWRANPGRVVFVGATNGGTALAEPQNWHDLVDLYTNLAAACARAVGLISGAAPVAEIVRGLIDSVGAFVKYLVSYAVTADGVPGLAAMEPDGSFVRRINETQPGQPAAGTPWFVVSSDFEARLLGDGHEPPELPGRLVAKLADGLVDRLMGTSNDLVVDTASMSAIDLGGGNFVQDSLPFGTNSRVYHLKYFIQPEVCGALLDWLVLREGTGLVDVGTTVSSDLPRSVRTNVLVLGSDEPISTVRAVLARSDPEWLVLERPWDAGTLHYAFDPGTVTDRIRGRRGAQSIVAALELREDDASTSVDLDEVLSRHRRNDDPQGGHATGTVVLDGGTPVGIIHDPAPPLSLDAIAQPRTRLLVPAADAPHPPRRRGTTTAPPTPVETVRGGEPQVTAHVAAHMPDRVRVGQVSTVTCRLSREQLVVATEGATDEGQAPVDPDRTITVQLVPKTNAETDGIDRVDIALPPTGDTADLYFDYVPTNACSCEVWIVVRQGPVPLLTLRLKAHVDPADDGGGAPAGPGRQTSAEASVSAEPIAGLENLQWFNIFETERRGEVVYRYEIRAEDLELLAVGESPALGDRSAYISNLYHDIEERWISSAEDITAFQRALQDYGSDLFSRLFPEAIQRALWSYRAELDRLVVLSDEPFIPWELVHLKDPDERIRPNEPHFLGQQGLVRWLYGAARPYPSTTLHAREGKVRSLCPQYLDPDLQLPETVDEEKYLATRFGAEAVEPTDKAVRQLLREGTFDLLHFAGHGVAEGMSIDQAKVLLADREAGRQYARSYLSATTVAQNANLLADKGDGGPLVVFNACQVGRIGYQLASLGGFAQAFLQGGAAAFVSSLWSVGDAPARTFVETFYDQLLDGHPIATAVTAAREKARAAGDATWLAYVVYAHPAARLDRPAPPPTRSPRRRRPAKAAGRRSPT